MILPDFLAPGLRIVFVGTAAGEQSAARGHYYAGRGNEFWSFLYEAGLTPALLAPEDDATVLDYRLGLTDLAKTVARAHDLAAHYDVPALVAKLVDCRPGIVAFTSKQAATGFARGADRPRPVSFGLLPWTVADRPAFVLPSPSGANRAPSSPPRIEWWRRLADMGF